MNTATLPQRFAEAMVALGAPDRLGLAVSGGSDSVALMHLAHDWGGAALQVATVDHGLRPDAAAEAADVARAAAQLGLPHVTLRWQGWDGRGNLQQGARDARHSLLRDWAQAAGLQAIALGHSCDDQAETLLMRLKRGSGVDGLAGMEAAREDGSIRWLRPLLGMSRAELRAWLRGRDLGWCDDPSNDDPRFDRVRTRQALAALGLDTRRLAQTATRMAEARVVLDQAARDAAGHCGRVDHGDIVFDRATFDNLPADTRHRLLAAALCEIATQPYRPRLSALQAALRAAQMTLHGCLVTRTSTTLRVTREAKAVRQTVAPVGALWDQRWQIYPPANTALPRATEIRALGPEGLDVCKDRRHWRAPRASLLASPAIWQGARLIAAPLAGFAQGWRATPRRCVGILVSLPVSH